MNLITHLLKKDIRRSRVLLGIWLLLLVLQGVLVSASVNPADRVMQALYAMISAIVPLLQVLLLLVIVPFVVHEEPLVGTTAFWLTRPLSARLVLKSKTLFALAILVLPSLIVQLIVLMANGFILHDVALAVPEIIMGQLTLIATIAIIAALTPSFGRYAIAAVVILVVWVIASLAVQWMRMYLNPDYFMAQGQNLSLQKSAGVAVSLLMIFSAGAIVAHQYLSRKTLRSIFAASIVVVAIFAVQEFWHWDFLARPIPRSGNPPFDVSAVKIDLRPREFASEVTTMRAAGSPRKNVWADIGASGVPVQYLVRPSHIHPHLKLPDGTELEATEPVTHSPAIQTYKDGLVFALGGTPVENAEKWSTATSLFLVNADVYAKYRSQSLTLSVDIDFTALKYDIDAEMPLAKGARFDKDSRHVVMTDILRQPNGVDISLRERKPNLLFDRANTFVPELDPGYSHLYLLRNKKRNQAVLQKRDNTNIVFDQVFGMSRLVNQPIQISFGPEPHDTRLTPALTPEWLADAELIRVNLVPVFGFSKRIVMENFKMDGKKASSNEANSD